MNKLRISIFTIAISLLAFSCEEVIENTGVNKSQLVEEDIVLDTNVKGIYKDVNAVEFKSLIENGGFLIDVRTAGEVNNGSIEGNTNIDFNSPDFKTELKKLDKNVPVMVYCASGGRSEKAMKIMKIMGFTEVYNLDGGYNGWPNK